MTGAYDDLRAAEVPVRRACTLIGRARGKRFIALAGEDRITFDVDVSAIADEPRGMNRKGATAE